MKSNEVTRAFAEASGGMFQRAIVSVTLLTACGGSVAPTRAEPNIAQVVTGGGAVCVRLSTGRVRCAGRNSARQLGDGTTTPHRTPIDVVGIEGTTSLSAWVYGVCAAERGTVSCWGNNAPQRASIPGVADAVDVVGRLDGGCARTTAGRVFCWGDNTQGQLGVGDTAPRTSAVEVVDLPPTIRIWAGPYRATCAVAADGSTRCWGSYGNNSTLRPELVRNLPRPIASAGGWHAFCAATESDIRCWGQFASTEPTNSARVVSVVSGVTSLTVADLGGRPNPTICALLSGGTIQCWAVQSEGQISGPMVRSDFPASEAIAADGMSMCSVAIGGGALHCSGDVLQWVAGADGGAQSLDTARAIEGIL